MIKIANTDTYGWHHAIRGMRNPMNSWEKSDSGWFYVPAEGFTPVWGENEVYCIGPNDKELMLKLRNAGTDHRKFMRMIDVSADITAPLYWWKEYDTYKVGTVANSCSTMHKIQDKEFDINDFSHEHLSPEGVHLLERTIKFLNCSRELFNQGKRKEDWWEMIQLLPSSYNQRRTVMLNYEVLANIYNARRNHKLDEWRKFCETCKTLPLSELITGETK